MATEIKAELVLASLNSATGDILYTWRLTYPRMILAEVNTHRVFSRNTSSSRAIPAKKHRERILNDPFIPTHIGANQKGMQAGAELSGWRRDYAEKLWAGLRYPAVAAHWALEKLGVHKQIVNRLLEPWMWVTQVLSGTEFENFFGQRDHKDAEPHFQELARQMHSVQTYAVSDFEHMKQLNQKFNGNLQILNPGEWHLPFASTQCYAAEHRVVSAARCARTSYLLPGTDVKSDYTSDLILFNRLSESSPKHLSPLEHPAEAMNTSAYYGNFKGFKQLRKFIPSESGVAA